MSSLHKMGDLRLVESEQEGDLRLHHPLPLDELLNLEGELRLMLPGSERLAVGSSPTLSADCTYA